MSVNVGICTRKKDVRVFGKSRTCFPERSYVFSVIIAQITNAHDKIYKKPHFNEMLNEKAVRNDLVIANLLRNLILYRFPAIRAIQD